MPDYHRRLVGLRRGLLEVLDNRSELPSYVSALRILDYFQYTNPPYVQKQMAEALDEPQSKISQLVGSLLENNVRIRLDFSHVPLGLMLLVVLFEGVKKPTGRLPISEWVATAFRTPRGILAVYRIPGDGLNDALEVIETRMSIENPGGKNAGIEYFEAYDSILARPSLEYWLYQVYDNDPRVREVNPVNAVKLLESHPKRIEGSDTLSLDDIDFRLEEPYIGFRDQIDLALISAMEISIFNVKSHDVEDLVPKKFSKPRYQASRHEHHISEIARGSKVMLQDPSSKDGIVTVILIVEGSERALRTLTEDMKKYPYTGTMIKLKNHVLVLNLMMPVAYVNSTISEIGDRYGVEIVHVYQVTEKDLVDKQAIPLRNYDASRRRWDFMSTEKTIIVNYLRGFFLKIPSEESLDEYIESLKRVHGEEKVKEIVRSLGYESVDEMINEWKRRCSGQTTRLG